MCVPATLLCGKLQCMARRPVTSPVAVTISSAAAFMAVVAVAHGDCPADLTGDLVVDGSDLGQILSNWDGPGGDITGDGTTSGADLSAILGAWGACPAPDPEWYLITTTNGTVTTAYDATTNAVVNTWTGAAGGASVGYLRADGSMVRPTIHVGGAYPGAARGGRIQVFNPLGAISNDLIVSTSAYQQHHDIRPMPNGNILCIVWEGHTQAQGTAAGRLNLTGAIWSESVLEIQPTGASTFTIVWRWNLWDHLVQDANASGANYGVVAQHPELVDINLGTIAPSGGDWVHMNSIDYNPTRDEIVMSSRTLNEIFVIDHSTTTAQSATHSGGARGKGGDLIYRWGNAANYDRGTVSDKKFDVVHSATWIRDGLPGAGNILAFNNGDRPGAASDYSTVMEVTPVRDAAGNYPIDAGAAFAPTNPSWACGSPGQFYGGQTQCGAFRTLDNTTIVTLTNSGNIFEVNSAGTTIWSRTNAGTNIARVPRYRQVNGSWIGP
ncbi:MAG: arylsulfotransferase (ASST) [Phycisphaerales bacterium]|nr:arylsulfotransferase (ASST) [Phycisphaerales bacterium]